MNGLINPHLPMCRTCASNDGCYGNCADRRFATGATMRLLPAQSGWFMGASCPYVAA